jgi:hypothetical protein
MQMSFSERNEGGRGGALDRFHRMGMEIRKNPFKISVDQKIRLIKHIGEKHFRHEIPLGTQSFPLDFIGDSFEFR